MKIKIRQIEINLPSLNDNATIFIEQESCVPTRRDGYVSVRWKLLLPADPETGYELHPHLRHDSWDCVVCGAVLNYKWSHLILKGCDNKYYVFREGYVSAPTWIGAFRIAEEYCRGELQKLIEALTRQKNGSKYSCNIQK